MIAENNIGLMEDEALKNPFPGLRAFDIHENDLFFGRDGQSEELILKLSKTHFLAVVGASGSGKSSLVRAGLLPSLYGGLMGKAGSGWHIAILRPGNDPIGNLARSLNEPGGLPLEDDESRDIQTQVNLRRGSLGLVEIVQQARLGPHENLLVLVDQFEELFRFSRISEDPEYKNDAALFVKLLLEAKVQPNIYVLLTMRSDYLGDCARFWDLPEAVNEGQYLIPRMTREDRRQAITGPVELRDAKIAPRLVNQLLNDMGDSPNQLPILQHALMRIWDKWRQEGNVDAELDLSHYETTGGMTGNLTLHADEAYAELKDERSQKIAERLFKSLTEKGLDDKETRRPTELNEICLVARATKKEVIDVIEIFRREGRSFLMPSPDVTLKGNTSIDISHESLISGWQRLKQWVEEEADSARVYRRLVEYARSARRFEKGELRDPWLQETLDWCEKNEPNRAWASRHHKRFYDTPTASRKIKKARDKEIFKLAMDFLDDSEKAHKRRENEDEQQRRRELNQARRFAGVLAVTTIIILVLGVNAVLLWLTAREHSKTITRLNYRSIMNQAQRAYDSGDFGEANKLFGAFPVTKQENSSWLEQYYFWRPPKEDLRGLEWDYLWRALHNERGTLNGHSGKVTSVAVSRNGIIATASLDKTIRLWDPSELKIVKESKDHQAAILSVAFASDGNTLAIGSTDGTVKLWKTNDNQQPITLLRVSQPDDPTLPSPVRSLAFEEDPRGKRLVIGSEDGSVRLWDTNIPREIWSVYTTPPETLSSRDEKKLRYVPVTFSPDGKVIASGKDHVVMLWDSGSGKSTQLLFSQAENEPQFLMPSNFVVSVAFSPDGKTIAAGYRDGRIRLWDREARSERPFLTGRPASVLSLAFVNDQRLISANSDATLTLWDASKDRKEPDRELRKFKGHSDEVWAVGVAPDGKTIISGSADTTAKLWNVDALPDTAKINLYKGPVQSVTFSPNPGDKIIAIASLDGPLKFWDLIRQKEVQLLQSPPSTVGPLAFSSDGKIIASGNKDLTVTVSTLATGESRSLGRHGASITSIAFSPDNKILATGSKDHTVKLWEVSSGRELKPLPPHDDIVWAVAFSPDGRFLATGSADKKIKIWNASSWAEIKAISGSAEVLSLTFSPNSKLLADGSADYAARVWEVERDFAPLATLTGHKNVILAVSFSSDGTRLATGCYDGSVKLWDTGTSSWDLVGKQEVITLRGNPSNVNLKSLAFSPGSSMIAMAKEDGSVEVWNTASARR